LAARTELRASLLTGSAALGICDEQSDVDLLNYYDSLPDRSAFDEALLAVGAERGGSIGEPGREGFVARYQLDGIELQTGASLIPGLEGRLQRIERGQVDWLLAKIAMGLLEGMPLYGEDVIAGWKRRLAYSEDLRRREVEANIGFFPIWRADRQLAARDAEMFRRQMLVEGAFRLVAVLSALNRVYFSTFQFKRAAAHFNELALKPDRLGERLDAVVNAPPSEAAEELRALVEETKALVTREMPEVDVEAAWQPPAER
jgi:hypothetical protein